MVVKVTKGGNVNHTCIKKWQKSAEYLSRYRQL